MKGICSWCNDAPGVYPCPDPQCPDLTALCVECEPIFLFCPDHPYMMEPDPETGELRPQFEWDPELDADINRILATTAFQLNSSDPGCPKCGGALDVESDFELIPPIGTRIVKRVSCLNCKTIITERSIWQPATLKFRQDQLKRWKTLLGELEQQLRVVENTNPDGTTDIVPLHPEWEAYLGDELAGKLRSIVRVAKTELYRNSVE